MGAGGWASRPVKITPRSWPYSALLGIDFYRQARRILASSAWRAGLGIFACSTWSSGGILELMLASPKVILELPGAHFGLSEGHCGAPESDSLSPRIDSELWLLLSAVLWDYFFQSNSFSHNGNDLWALTHTMGSTQGVT